MIFIFRLSFQFLFGKENKNVYLRNIRKEKKN